MAAQTKSLKLALVGLGFSGWALMLAGVAVMQKRVQGMQNPTFRNFPVEGVMDCLVNPSGPGCGGMMMAAGVSPFTGASYSYSWWLVVFQLVSLVYCAAVASTAAKGTAVGLMTVLATSTFIFTNSVLNAPFGAYALSHNSNGKPASVIGTHANKDTNAVFVLFSGLIVVDIANVLLAMVIGQDSVFAEPAVSAAAAPAEEKVDEVKAVAADAAVEASAV